MAKLKRARMTEAVEETSGRPGPYRGDCPAS
jgi:hypothetical protein